MVAFDVVRLPVQREREGRIRIRPQILRHTINNTLPDTHPQTLSNLMQGKARRSEYEPPLISRFSQGGLGLASLQV